MKIAMRKTPLPSQALGQTLMLVARDFQRRLDRDLNIRGIRGIGARHRAVFLYLGRYGASRAVDLAVAAGIRPQSMMKIVHELEALGLVERREDPADSRAKLIDFTEQGRALIAELSRSTETVWRQYAEILGKDVLQETLKNLNTLLAGENTRE
jgi:DNA-binding MarR family transcriptional regulator